MTPPLTLAPIEKLRNWISSQHTGLCKMLSKGDECDCPLCCLDNIADLLASAPQEPLQTYYQKALDLVADEMREATAEQYSTRRDKWIAVIRNAAVASAPQESPQGNLKRKAVANCYMMAKREIARILNGKAQVDALSLERWKHVLRFCEESGEKSSILRDGLPTEMTDGASAPQTGSTEAEQHAKALESVIIADRSRWQHEADVNIIAEACEFLRALSAPQEPPQDCICDEDEIRLHMPDPRCEAPNCKAVASAPQTVSTELGKLADELFDDGLVYIAGASEPLRRHRALDVVEKVARRLRALSTASAPPQGWQPHEHDFSEYVVCRVCGQTEAAIVGCHHCNEAKPGALCWWCLRPAPPASPSEEKS